MGQNGLGVPFLAVSGFSGYIIIWLDKKNVLEKKISEILDSTFSVTSKDAAVKFCLPYITVPQGNLSYDNPFHTREPVGCRC